MSLIPFSNYSQTDKSIIVRASQDLAPKNAHLRSDNSYTVELPDSGDTIVVRRPPLSPFSSSKPIIDLLKKGLGKAVSKATEYISQSNLPTSSPVEKSSMAGKTKKSTKYTLPSTKKGTRVDTSGGTAIMYQLPPGNYSRQVRQAPVAVSNRVSRVNKPQFSRGAKGVLVKHTEFIGSMISSGNSGLYKCTSYTVNPGKMSTFPWLSPMAGNFDKYVLHSLKFNFISSQPTSTAGKVGIGFDFDSTDPLPADRAEFFSLTRHVECAPWDSISLAVPTDGISRFVNSHTVTDSKLIDVGMILVMSDQITATSANLGDITVEYVVELLDPQQAVYTTMAAYDSSSVSWGTALVVGPAIGQYLPAKSSATSGYWSLPQGYYIVTSYASDSGGGGPTLSLAIHGGTGYADSIGASGAAIATACFQISTNDGEVRCTVGGVTIDLLEKLVLTITRVAAPLFTLSGVQFGSAVGIY